jgi:hypothetical protein
MNYFKNPVYWFSGAFALLAGVALVFQDAGRTNKAISQTLVIVLLLLSLFWQQAEPLGAAKPGETKQKFEDKLHRFNRRLVFSSACLMFAYGVGRILIR